MLDYIKLIIGQTIAAQWRQLDASKIDTTWVIITSLQPTTN